MSKVYVTTYEIIGDGIALYDSHYADVDAAKAAHWAFSQDVGGVGYRGETYGRLRSVFFKELPTGWRKVGTDRGYIEAVPHKGSVRGKQLAAQIAKLPRVPETSVLAKRFGYSPPELAIDQCRGRIYFPTDLSLEYPAKRYFLRLPRFTGDQFAPDEATLRAIPESELLKAVEDHNSEVDRQREGGAV